MIADRIRQARLAAGLTLGVLGEQVGVSHTAIQKYEKGLLTPSSTQLLKLARACGISTSLRASKRPSPSRSWYTITSAAPSCAKLRLDSTGRPLRSKAKAKFTPRPHEPRPVAGARGAHAAPEAAEVARQAQRAAVFPVAAHPRAARHPEAQAGALVEAVVARHQHLLQLTALEVVAPGQRHAQIAHHSGLKGNYYPK